MLITFVAATIILSVLLRGDPRRLGQIDFRRLPWILASFVVRDASEELFKSSSPPLAGSLALAFVCYGILFYGLWPNLELPGMRMVALGSISNLVVILANEGRMPVSVANLSPADQARELARLAVSINHQVLAPGARLPFLADLFKWTFLQPKPLMFSVGDVLISLGVSWLMLRVSLRGSPAKTARDTMG